MGGISFTAHLSNKKSAINSKTKLEGVAKHNLRKYRSDEYCFDKIVKIRGTTNLVQDVKKIYHQEFDEVLKEYNGKQTRPDRRIKDYFEHVANKEQDMAVEIIIQVGDREFWKDNGDVNMKRQVKMLYIVLLEELEKLIPQFVIANAVVHLDEESPHVHVVGVPVASGYKNGLRKQVSKRKVFTKEVLSDVLQGSFRDIADYYSNMILEERLREKEKGRNHDLTVLEYKVKKEKNRYNEIKTQTDKKEQENQNLETNNKNLYKENEIIRMLLAAKQKDYSDTDKRLKEALEQFYKNEIYIKEQKAVLKEIEEKVKMLEKNAEIAKMVYERARGSDEYYTLREDLIKALYENDQLKFENSRLKEKLNKAYEFMKQFSIDGMNLLERFLRSIGEVMEKVRNEIRSR